MNLRERFRIVVAMWIFVGLIGGPFMILLAAAALTGAGPFAPQRTVVVDAQFAPGQEIKVRGNDGTSLRPGDFLILASPASVDPAALACQWKSRVYSTGEQRSGTIDPVAVDGLEPVVTDPASGVEYAPVTTTARGTGWMEVDYLTCDGPGVQTFAVSEDSSMSVAARQGVGFGSVLFGILVTALGFGALKLTRHWSRQRATQAQYGHPGQYGPGPHPGPHPGQFPGPHPGPHPGQFPGPYSGPRQP